MIIYFLETNKLYTFKLPLEKTGNYILTDYDNAGNKRDLVSVEAKDDTWVIHDNDETRIFYNNTYLNELALKQYEFYQLIVNGTDRVLMYVSPAYDDTFSMYSLPNNMTLEIGKEGNDINYPLLSSKQLQLSYQNGQFSFKNLDLKTPIYVNNVRKDNGVINGFDTLFIMGLKIFILGNYLYINSPNHMVTISSTKFIEPVHRLLSPDYKATSELYKDFYDEKDYFFKTPVFQNALEKLVLTIAAPPAKSKNQRDPLFLIIVPSGIMSITSLLMGYYAFVNITQKGGTIEDNLMTIIMCISMLVACVVWPFVERVYENYVDRKEEAKRTKRYQKYLKEKEATLVETVNRQKAILKGNYLSLEECKEAVYHKMPNLFSRGYGISGFLEIRLGIGSVPIYASIDYDQSEYVEFDDALLDQAQELITKYKYLDNSPYFLSLYEKNIISFIGSYALQENYMSALLLQLLTYHSYQELKIVILTDKATSTFFKYLKDSPYCFRDDKSFRFFANNIIDGQNLSEYLEKEIIVRKKNNHDQKDKSDIPYYLIITDNILMYRNLKIIHLILEEKKNFGFGLLMFDTKVTNIPDGCENFVNYNEREGSFFTSKMNADSIQKFSPEFLPSTISMEEVILKLSNTPLKTETSEGGQLPNSLGFLELYGIGKIEQLNILQRWSNTNIVNSLTTPIGVDENGNILSLDLHEKKHGPHGLIAGMTGSGKSEFIITYILSLAVNYSPYEVQFVLIDYKGGGLAGAFENRKTGVKLPHLIGTITNLDKAEMNRTLVSIKSELQRRQRIFNETKEQLELGTIDIYKYQKLVHDGTITVPLSHLFIICDEFAELKAQQPDFMDELVSTARIGRSLGVHLILATQKPSGVVDEQIWSNSKFKICCKVQTVEDSNEMLRKADAAYLKEAGRFYLQVGYDEYYVKGQSAYTGGNYIPSSKVRTKVSSGVDFINNLGEIVKSASSNSNQIDKSINLGEELTNVLKEIIDSAKTIGYQNQQLWLDNVPKELYLDNLRKKYPLAVKPFLINPLIGEYDDPHNQAQGPVLSNVTEIGNTFIVGVSGSGKTTLLSTFLYSVMTTHRVEEVNFYLIDLTTERLNQFVLAPQVSEYFTVNDKGKIEKLFYYLEKISEKRKKHYVSKGGSFEQDVKKGASIFPNIIIVINGFDVFKEQFETIYEDQFAPFSRDCNKQGIYFIVTGTSPNSLGYMIENSFPQTIALKLSDPSDYSMLFSTSFNDTIVPNDNPGRGLIDLDQIYEFQTSMVFDYASFDTNLSYIIAELNKLMPQKAPRLPVLPNYVTIASFKNEMISLSALPIGIEVKSAYPYFYNFNHLLNLITFKKEPSVKSFVPALVDLFSYLKNEKTIVLSAYDYITIENEKVPFYNANFKSVLKALQKNFSKVLEETTTSNHYTVIVFGYSKLQGHMNNLKEESETPEDVVTLDDLILLMQESTKISFVLFDKTNLLRSVDDLPWYNLVNLNNGIIVAGETDSQELFMVKEDYNNNSVNRDEAIVIENGSKKVIKFVNK